MAPQRGHRKRCVRWDTPRAVHYLTFSCQKRRAFFSEGWPWSSARAWAKGVDEPIPIDRDTLPPLELSRPGEY